MFIYMIWQLFCFNKSFNPQWLLHAYGCILCTFWLTSRILTTQHISALLITLSKHKHYFLYNKTCIDQLSVQKHTTISVKNELNLWGRFECSEYWMFSQVIFLLLTILCPLTYISAILVASYSVCFNLTSHIDAIGSVFQPDIFTAC
jgi:hypothetical protein